MSKTGKMTRNVLLALLALVFVAALCLGIFFVPSVSKADAVAEPSASGASDGMLCFDTWGSIVTRLKGNAAYNPYDKETESEQYNAYYQSEEGVFKGDGAGVSIQFDLYDINFYTKL